MFSSRIGGGDRDFVNGVLWTLRSGWKDLPDNYGKWKSVHEVHALGQGGDWERIFQTLLGDPNNTYVMIDSTIVRAHQHAVCGKGGVKTRLWGVQKED